MQRHVAVNLFLPFIEPLNDIKSKIFDTYFEIVAEF